MKSGIQNRRQVIFVSVVNQPTDGDATRFSGNRPNFRISIKPLYRNIGTVSSVSFNTNVTYFAGQSGMSIFRNRGKNVKSGIENTGIDK